MFFIAISGNTASAALKLTIIEKAHRQVIADRLAHSIRQTQTHHDIICQKSYQRHQKQQHLTLVQRSVEQVTK